MEQRTLEYENAIADCMVSQGFGYVAELSAAWLAERAETLALVDGHPDPGAVGAETFLSEAAKRTANDTYRDSLDQAEREAFGLAYYGSANGKVAGCYNSTYDAVWASDPGSDSVEITEEIIADLVTGTVDEEAELSAYEACMVGYGFVVSGLNQIYEHLYEVRRDIVDGRAPGVSLEDAVAEYQPLIDAGYTADDECRSDYNDAKFALIDKGLSERFADG